MSGEFFRDLTIDDTKFFFLHIDMLQFLTFCLHSFDFLALLIASFSYFFAVQNNDDSKILVYDSLSDGWNDHNFLTTNVCNSMKSYKRNELIRLLKYVKLISTNCILYSRITLLRQLKKKRGKLKKMKSWNVSLRYLKGNTPLRFHSSSFFASSSMAIVIFIFIFLSTNVLGRNRIGIKGRS